MATRCRYPLREMALALAGLSTVGCAATHVAVERLESTAIGDALVPGPSSPDVTLERLAKSIDRLEWEIVREGTIGIKAPDIWGQDRMTKSRAEYEQQLAGQQKDGFKSVMSAVIRRYEAVTSQIELDAVATEPTNGATKAGGAASTTSATAVVKPAPLVAAPPRDATDKEPIGIESTVVLDERSHFLNHLNQLRRINAGDELTDRPGYGLYLIRMPITLAPGRGANRGLGAMVTVEARPYLPPNLLPDTVRRVVLTGTKDQLRPVLLGCLRGVHSPSGGGAVPLLSAEEVEALYGRENLKALCETAKAQIGADLEREPHRAEVRVAEWLDGQLSALYTLAASDVPAIEATAQAGPPVASTNLMADLAAGRRFAELARLRDTAVRDPRVVRTGVDEVRIDGAVPVSDEGGRASRTLTFALKVQAAAVDRMIREDIKKFASDPGRGRFTPDLLSLVDALTFAGAAPSDEARRLFNEYVTSKWRIRVFAIEPVLEQQNVADYLSRRSMRRIDLAGLAGAGAAAGGAAGSAGAQADLDAASVRLNPTMVGFGAGESTFGWRFYPRVQVPPPDTMVRRAEKALLGSAVDEAERQVEPGQRECTALVVMPNFVPAIEFTTIAGWFHHSAIREVKPSSLEDAIALCKKLERLKHELVDTKQRMGSGSAHLVRHSDVQILEDRLQQLEDILPTQHYVSALPYGSDPVDAEIFESRGGNLAPTLTAWHGQPPDASGESSLMIEGRGFSVHDTRVLVGNMPAESTPISRTVLLVKIAANAPAMTAPDGKTYYDVHVATPNGVSNHLLIEVHRGSKDRPNPPAPPIKKDEPAPPPPPPPPVAISPTRSPGH